MFCKIIKGEIPSKKIFEDDEFVVFNDINPAASTHVLLVPKNHLDSLNELDNSVLAGKMLLMIPKVAKMLGIQDSYRTIINTGSSAGQSVLHVHIHILGGKHIGTPK